MKRTRRHHSREFKQEAVALVVEQGYSCAAAGRSLGVSDALIGRWKDELETQKAEAFPGQGNAPPSNNGSMRSNRRIVGCGWSATS